MILRKLLITRWQLLKHEHKILGRTRNRNFIVGTNSPWGETGIVPELSLGCLKDTKFYVESKAYFIHISSIALFKPFLIAWLWEQYGTIFSCCTIKHFFFFKYILYSTVLSKYLKKKIRGHRAHLRKKGHYFTIELSLREISYILNKHTLMC